LRLKRRFTVRSIDSETSSVDIAHRLEHTRTPGSLPSHTIVYGYRMLTAREKPSIDDITLTSNTSVTCGSPVSGRHLQLLNSSINPHYLCRVGHLPTGGRCRSYVCTLTSGSTTASFRFSRIGMAACPILDCLYVQTGCVWTP
jgi:hypothetical protein